MKHTKLILVFALALALLVLCSCAKEGISGKKRTVNVYNWGEYISDGSEDSLDVNKAFEEYYRETYGEDVEVIYTTYASNEDLYAKLKSGAAGYDVIIPSDYMIARLIDEDMLEKIDFSNVPNYEYITDDFRSLYYDPEDEYSIPYTYGMIGVIYNSEFVDEADTGTWDIMWNEKYSGEILQYNNSRDAFGTAMYRAGIDVNTNDEGEWREALDALKEQQPMLQSYVMDEIFNKMESGEAHISSYYAGDYLTMCDNNESLCFYYPSAQGEDFATNLFVDAYCIPKGAKNKDLAEIYINYMLSEEPAIANAEYICYASPNSIVYENETYADDMGEDAMEILYPEGFSFADNYNRRSYHNLEEDTLQMVNSLWEELKISSPSGVGVNVCAALIIVLSLAFAVRSAIVKNKRKKLY